MCCITGVVVARLKHSRLSGTGAAVDEVVLVYSVLFPTAPPPSVTERSVHAPVIAVDCATLNSP